MSNRLYLLDVFAEQPLAGNPLAVVVLDATLPDAVMQRFAAEMNFSETTFVFPRQNDDGSFTARIFTPVREIAFAGHPILGTAWVVRNHLLSERVGQVLLDLDVGRLAVSFEVGPYGKEIVWFTAPPIVLGACVDKVQLASALGLTSDDIDTGYPAQLASSNTSAIIVPLVGLEALSRARLDLEAFAGLAAQGLPPLVYLFCRGARRPDADLSARFFFEADGVREDPATGNGAAFLGAYLLEHHVFAGDALDLCIDQGANVGRPSVVMLRARKYPRVAVQVGGGVIPTVVGQLL